MSDIGVAEIPVTDDALPLRPISPPARNALVDGPILRTLLWLAWPKRSSGVSTDLGDGVVRELGLAAGLVDNKVCAIDQVWSGLRFVYRLADRPRRYEP